MSEPDLKEDYPSRKEVYKMFYMTKGHLNASESTMYSCYWGYFKRAWYNTEFYRAEEGFEEAWIEYQNNVSYSKEK